MVQPLSPKSMRYASVAICIALLGVPFYIGAKFVYWVAWGENAQVRKLQTAIIHPSNPPEVLSACRDVLASPKKFRANPDWHPASADNLDPRDPALPAVIKNLGPKSIAVDPGHCVTMEFGGGPNHFGLRAFAVGVDGFGRKEIAPGLWYYSDYDVPR